MRRGVELHARYVLVFASDLANPENTNAFLYAAQHRTPSTMTDCSEHNLTLSTSGRVAPMAGASGQPDDYSQFFDGRMGTVSGTSAPVTNTNTWLYPTALPQTEALAVLNGADGNNESNSGGGFGFGIAGGAAGGTGSHLVAYFPGVGWLDSGYDLATRTA